MSGSATDILIGAVATSVIGTVLFFVKKFITDSDHDKEGLEDEVKKLHYIMIEVQTELKTITKYVDKVSTLEMVCKENSMDIQTIKKEQERMAKRFHKYNNIEQILQHPRFADLKS